MKQATLKSALLTLVLFFISFFKGYSIGNETQIGAREVSLGNAAVSLISAFSVFNNQAALAQINRITVAIDYRQPFLIEGYTDRALAAVVPLPVANFAFSLQQRGIQGYNESRFGFAMARTLGKRFSAGLQFNYFMADFPEDGSNRGTFLIEFGMLFQTRNNVTIGLHVFNPGYASIESLNFRSNLPFRVSTGIALKPSANLLLVGAMVYCTDRPLNFSLGIEYQFSDSFFLRCGLSGKPIRHSAGLGYKWSFFGIDVSMMHHETLGYTPSISLVLTI
jgi:hypothetical protein